MLQTKQFIIETKYFLMLTWLSWFYFIQAMNIKRIFFSEVENCTTFKGSYASKCFILYLFYSILFYIFSNHDIHNLLFLSLGMRKLRHRNAMEITQSQIANPLLKSVFRARPSNSVIHPQSLHSYLAQNVIHRTNSNRNLAVTW